MISAGFSQGTLRRNTGPELSHFSVSREYENLYFYKESSNLLELFKVSFYPLEINIDCCTYSTQKTLIYKLSELSCISQMLPISLFLYSAFKYTKFTLN